MNLYIFSQILFNLIASIAIIVLGVLFAIATYHLIYIMKHLQNISDNLDNVTDEFKMRVEDIIEKLSSLPIFSFFLKKGIRHKSDLHNKKGRN